MSGAQTLQRIGQGLHQLSAETIARDPELADTLRELSLGLIELRARIGHGGLSSTGPGLVITIWNTPFVLALSDIRQILPESRAKELPPEVPVVDLRQRLGLPKKTGMPRSLLLLERRDSDAPLALLVDALGQVVDIGEPATPPWKVLSPDRL